MSDGMNDAAREQGRRRVPRRAVGMNLAEGKELTGRRVKEWKKFEALVAKHIEETESGHYCGEKKKIDVIDFMDSQLGGNSLYPWMKDAVKYLVRFPRTRNPVDLMKAAHYVCRMYQVAFGTDDGPEADG